MIETDATRLTIRRPIETLQERSLSRRRGST